MPADMYTSLNFGLLRSELGILSIFSVRLLHFCSFYSNGHSRASKCGTCKSKALTLFVYIHYILMRAEAFYCNGSNYRGNAQKAIILY